MGTREPVIDQLRSYSAFAICDREDLRALATVSGHFVVPSQWSFLHQGTPAHELYVITAGSAQVYRDRVPIVELGIGEVVGEMAFFGNGQRQASVSSLERLRGLRIPYRSLADIDRQRPQIVHAIRGVCAARLGSAA
jgi:CRP-like cAMP-binding protein